MLNLNSLYKAVFKPEYRRFDPINDYYTILMDTSAFAPLYEEFNDRIEYLLNAEAYTYLHSEADRELDRDVVEDKLSEITEMLDMRTNGAPPARRFCLLAYFDDDHQDIGGLVEQLAWLNKDGRDVVTMLVCLSKRMSDKPQFLNRLADALGEKANDVDLFIFTDAHTAYYRRALIHSICGAIVMNAKHESYQARKTRKSAALTAVRHSVAALGDDGKMYLESLRPICWSSLHCKYYDKQYDFLNQYIADACANVKRMSKEDFTAILDGLYQSMIPQRDIKEVKSVLKSAVKQIPYVMAAEPKQTGGSLRNYFDEVYGDRGVATVELTLKATLSGVYNYRIEDLARKCSEQVFAQCAGFATEDLYDQISELVNWYVKSVRESCNSAMQSINGYLDGDLMGGLCDSDIDEYLEKYIQYYLKQKTAIFWEEVRRLIVTYPDNYGSYCKQSKDNHQQLARLRESIPTNSIYQFEGLKSRSYTAAQLLCLESDEDNCAAIRALFGTCRDDGKGAVAPDDCGMVFSIPVASQFCKGAKVELKTASYTMCGWELNGQYFVMMGAEQDV